MRPCSRFVQAFGAVGGREIGAGRRGREAQSSRADANRPTRLANGLAGKGSFDHGGRPGSSRAETIPAPHLQALEAVRSRTGRSGSPARIGKMRIGPPPLAGAPGSGAPAVIRTLAVGRYAAALRAFPTIEKPG